MAAGYEARARITADVSGFVAGARSVATASNTAAAAVRSLTTQLLVNQRAVTQAASNMRTFSQAASTVASAQQQSGQSATQAAQAAGQMAQAYNQGAQAAQRAGQAHNANAQAQNTNAQSLQRMGRELARLRAEQERYQSLVAQGHRLNRDQAESFDQVQQRIGQLTRDYLRLNTTQREQVTAARELAQASRLAAQGIQEYSAASVRMSQAGRLTNTQLQQLARQLQQVSQQYLALNRVKASGQQVTSQEAAAHRHLRQVLLELRSTYNQLDAAQRNVVDGARTTASATQAAATATRNLGSGAREARGGLDSLDDSLWSLRSALGDLQGFLTQITSGFMRASSELARTFSEQEMAIAHISRVTQATMGEMDVLTSGIRELAKVIPLPFEELAQIARLGAQVGIAKDAILDFTETVALFAATTDVTAEAASTMFARIQQMTDIDDTQFRNLGASVSELGSNSAATEQEILTVIESIATMASQSGMTGEAIIGLGGAMASLRIRPEIARGATQRVFLQLTSAVEEAGTEMERLTGLTNLSGAELQNLAANDFDQFFMRIMEGLSGASEAGESLVPVLRELGINNTRDAEVIARLAGNYDVLASSMDMAHDSFERGTYLQQEADRIFQTITAQVQVMANAWDQFKFAVVAAIGPFIESVVSGATAVMEFVGESEALVALLGRFLIVGAVTAGFAGLVAIISGLIQAWLALRGLLATTVVTMGLMSTTAASSATTMGLLAGAVRGAGASLVGFAASAGAAGLAARALGAALKLIAPLAIITAILAAVEGFKALTQSAVEANQAHLTAAGGVETLKQAMIEDTQAALDSKDALVFRRQSLEEMSEEEIEASRAARELASGQRSLSDELGTSTDVMTGTVGAAQDTAGAYSELGAEASAVGVAIGQANQAFAASAVESVVTESGVLRNREAFQMLREELQQFDGLGGLIEMELSDAGSASEALSETWWEMAESLGPLERLISDITSLLNSLTGGFIDLRGDSALALDAIKDLEGGFEGISEAQIEAINSMELFDGELEVAEDGTVQLVGGLDELSGGMEGVGGAAEEGGGALAEFAENASNAFGGISALGQGLKEEEQTLANYAQELENMLEARANFASNLLQLQGRVSDETLAILAANEEQFAPIIDEMAGASDEVVSAWDEDIRLLEGDLKERWTAAMEGLAEASADGATHAVDGQLEEINRLFAENELTAEEYVEALESLTHDAALSTSTLTQDQLDLINSLYEGGTYGAQQWARSLIEHFRMAGDEASMAIAGQIDEQLNMFFKGEQSAGEMVNNIMEILANGDFTIDPELNKDDVLTASGQLTHEVEESAANAEAIYTPALNTEPSEVDMDALSDYIELLATNSDPTFEPDTEGSQAEREMNSTRTRIERTASKSRPTINARTSGSSAYTDMSNIMSNLRSMASTIWVTIGAVAGGVAAKGRRRDGGWIDGAGGPRQDANLYAVSDKEFVVNARDAADYAPVLEWINSQRGRGGGTMPSTVPQDIMRLPSTPITGRSMAPDSVQGAQRTRMDMRSPGMVINVNNTYPQAEPTSVTINRSLQYAELLEGAVQ